MMANRSDRRLLTLRCVRALEAVGMSTRTRRADFHQGQGSFATPISQAGYMTATRFPLSVPHPCTRAGSIYDTTLRRHPKMKSSRRATKFGISNSGQALASIHNSAPRSVCRAGDLDTPVIHDFSIDETVDGDTAHGESLTGLWEAVFGFSDIGAADGQSHNEFVVCREDVIDLRSRIGEQRPPRNRDFPCSFQPTRPVGKVGRAEGKVGRANFVDDAKIAFSKFFDEAQKDGFVFFRRHRSLLFF